MVTINVNMVVGFVGVMVALLCMGPFDVAIDKKDKGAAVFGVLIFASGTAITLASIFLALLGFTWEVTLW